MKLPWFLAPWSSRQYWRHRARESEAKLAKTVEVCLAQRGDIAVLTRSHSFVLTERNQAREDQLDLIAERDEAIRELQELKRRRSSSVSRGNRTRALRRRGALMPELLHDTTAGREAELRTQLAG